MKVASVVIPAHNESAVIPSTLRRLAEDALAPTLEVAVVANACDDDTAAVARRFAGRLPGLTVIETDTPGKANALNLGDDATTAFPRIYLDADIVLGPDALAGMVTDLATDQPAAGSPEIEFDLDGADRWVRAYYRIFERLPYVTEGLVGLGVYGVSARGRERFDRFPDVLGDDLFIQRLFDGSERLRTPGAFRVRTPRRWGDLVKVRARVDRGNGQLASTTAPEQSPGFGRTSGSSVSALARLVAAEPRLVPAAVVYLATTVLGRVRAFFTDSRSWGRDESSRGAATDAAGIGLPDGAIGVSRG